MKKTEIMSLTAPVYQRGHYFGHDKASRVAGQVRESVVFELSKLTIQIIKVNPNMTSLSFSMFTDNTKNSLFTRA